MKILKRILLGFLAIFLLFIALGVFIGIYYGAEVKSMVVNEINQRLLTKMDVKHVDFSVLKKFPYGSVEFTDVVIIESVEKANKDTLLKASGISLHFNLFEIFKGKYNLKKIQVDNAIIKPVIGQKGEENFIFWKTDPKSQDQDISFSIDEVLLKNVAVFYTNYKSEDKIIFKTEQTVLKGDFSSKHYLLKIKSSLFADQINFENINYIKKQPLKINLELDINNEKNSYTINNSHLSVADLNFVVNGNIEKQNELTGIDLKIIGKDINIKSLLSLLPENYSNYTSSYSGSGNFYFNGTISGNSSEHESPSFLADFGINKGEMLHKNSSVKVEKINLKGSFNSGSDSKKKTSFLDINEFNCQIGSGNFSGDFSIRDFQNPSVRLSTVSSFELAELADFFQSDTLENIHGKVKIDASYSGIFKSKDTYTAEDFRKSKTSGKIVLSSIEFSLKNDPLVYKDISGELLFDNNDLIISELSGKISESDFVLTGFFRNVFPYYFVEDQKLIVDAKLRSSKINLDELFVSSDNSSKDTIYDMHFSKRASFYLDAEVGEIVFRKFQAKNINGKIVLKDQKLTTQKIQFSAMDGQIETSVSIDGSDGNNFKVASQAVFSNIDVSKMFYQFENFGQQLMQEKHIKGSASASVRFSALYDNKLNIDDKSIACNADITIEKGELLNFEPMKQLSSFIRVPDLQQIKFSTLHNVIEIVNEKIYIPKMEINSSAIDISIAGVHGFNDNVDYRFRLLLSDLLAGKVRESNKNNNEFGSLEEDDRRRMSVFISMKGHIDNPKFSYDGVGLKEKMKEDLQSEKKTVKGLLKEEFGLYKSDSTVSTPVKKKQSQLEVEWEENKKSTEDPKKEKAKPSLTPDKKEKGKFGKWLDKVGEE
ncbi:MAG: hypothetical protein H0V01_00580 [Bacteroidetes bacterium]|nr:hypothetical protein [Bacteroidota bacterium]HET6245628.1 AsmA-like C-terminal region-containing protein [Bacteroidia bacterium]